MDSANFEQEKSKLLEEIGTLKKSIDWYKRTYEERSLASLIYDKLFKKQVNSNVAPKAKIGKTNSQFSGAILCAVVNHNYTKNASALRDLLIKYYDTVIIDSGSDSPPNQSLKLGNVYYSGLLNTAYSVAKHKRYKYLLFVCSDVLVVLEEASKMYDRLSSVDLSKIGIYSPASVGFSHSFCKKQPSGKLREVPFVEGFMFLCDMEILDNICPINTQINLYGWGLDIATSFYAKAKNKLIVIDDNVEVEHLQGTGYSREIAQIEMLHWIKSLNNEALLRYFETSIREVQ